MLIFTKNEKEANESTDCYFLETVQASIAASEVIEKRLMWFNITSLRRFENYQLLLVLNMNFSMQAISQ